MHIARFQDLLRAAHQQAEPQRLLFVFTSAALPGEATPEQCARFQLGRGGTLTPLMCVEKSPAEVSSFGALLEESRRAGPAWDMVFVAALSGTAGRSPTSADAEAPMRRMVESIQSGRVSGFVPFDAQGQPVRFD